MARLTRDQIIAWQPGAVLYRDAAGTLRKRTPEGDDAVPPSITVPMFLKHGYWYDPRTYDEAVALPPQERTR